MQYFVHVPAEKLFGWIAHQFRTGPVDERATSPQIDPVQTLTRGFEQQLELLRQPRPLLFGLPSLGDVAHERIEQVRLLDTHVSDCQFDGELLTISPQGRDLDPLIQHRAFTRCQKSSQAARVSFTIAWRNDGLGQAASQGLFSRPAKRGAGLAVPIDDPPGHVHGHDGVVGRIQNQPRLEIIDVRHLRPSSRRASHFNSTSAGQADGRQSCVESGIR